MQTGIARARERERLPIAFERETERERGKTRRQSAKEPIKCKKASEQARVERERFDNISTSSKPPYNLTS